MSSLRADFQFFNNQLAIRQEIQRFESVHPSIYAIYDLIELIPDQQIAHQIRDHVVCIEDSFVNSQEWTLSRSVPELRLGIVGSINSGKSALVHRYLTGSYMQEESPEGGRFKKEILIDNQSYLLLIRDEGGLPEMQFSSWIDAVIFVFSLENEPSFNSVYNFYTKMFHFRNSADIPIILVGTQDAINDQNPRIIDETRARKLASELRHCSYYETCATYGLNIECVFQEACQKIVQQRQINLRNSMNIGCSRPTTPQGTRAVSFPMQSQHHHSQSGFHSTEHNSHSNTSSPINQGYYSPQKTANDVKLTKQQQKQQQQQQLWQKHQDGNERNDECDKEQQMPQQHARAHPSFSPNQARVELSDDVPPEITQSPSISNNSDSKMGTPPVAMHNMSCGSREMPNLPTPLSTPTTTRKSRRRSNLFITSSKKAEDKSKYFELGSGRAIPIKQGYLYKRSINSLNKEWKKKYVTLCDNGRLTYHSSLHDYMDDAHGKEIALQYVTVKIPGQKPRGSKLILTNSTLAMPTHPFKKTSSGSKLNCIGSASLAKERNLTEKVLLTAFDVLREPAGKSSSQTSGDELIASNSSQPAASNDSNPSKNDSNLKKRHRRIISIGAKNNEVDDSETYEFCIVSLEGKQWQFEASSAEERDEWVSVIDQEIFKLLQSNVSSKLRPQSSKQIYLLQTIKDVIPGNNFCADCDAPGPEWASLNLGVLMCIECSGIHRNLGSHISKVRSLSLDEWTMCHLSVMLSIGNALANSVYEASIRNGLVKPNRYSSREVKEQWIRCKYEAKEFLAHSDGATTIDDMIVSIIRCDMKGFLNALARASVDDINSTVSACDLRTPLHIACSMGNLAVAQLLIWSNANVNQVDNEGRTCLSYAKSALRIAPAHSSTSTLIKSASVSSILPSLCNQTNLNMSSPTQHSIDNITALADLLTELTISESPRRSDLIENR